MESEDFGAVVLGGEVTVETGVVETTAWTGGGTAFLVLETVLVVETVVDVDKSIGGVEKARTGVRAVVKLAASIRAKVRERAGKNIYKINEYSSSIADLETNSQSKDAKLS